MVASSSTNSAIVRVLRPWAIETTASTTSWSVGAAEVGDELAVDLQVVKLEMLEVVEGREAGAEVIQCELATERLQLLRKRATAL